MKILWGGSATAVPGRSVIFAPAPGVVEIDDNDTVLVEHIRGLIRDGEAELIEDVAKPAPKVSATTKPGAKPTGE